MPIAAIELIAKVLLLIGQWGVKKYRDHRERVEFFTQMCDMARKMNIKTIEMRKKAEKQYDAGSAKWDEIEDLEQKERTDKK